MGWPLVVHVLAGHRGKVPDPLRHTRRTVFPNQREESFLYRQLFPLLGCRLSRSFRNRGCVLRRWLDTQLPNTREIVVVLDGLKFSQSWAV